MSALEQAIADGLVYPPRPPARVADELEAARYEAPMPDERPRCAELELERSVAELVRLVRSVVDG